MNLRKRIVLAVLPCLLVLGALFYLVEPAAVAAALRGVSPGPVILGLLVVQMQIVLSAVRWRFTAARLGHEIGLWRAIREYYIGSLLNQVLPGGMAGDAIRAYRSRNGEAGGWKRPAGAVVLERLSGQAVFFLLAATGLAVWPFVLASRMPEGLATFVALVLPLLAACLILGAMLWKSKHAAGLKQWTPQIKAAFWHRGAFFVQAVLSLLAVAGYVAMFMIASAAVGAPLPIAAALTVIPLCLLTMLIPAGIAGWGTREAAAAALWPLFGFSGAEGLSASLLYGVLSLAGAALPGVVMLLLPPGRG